MRRLLKRIGLKKNFQNGGKTNITEKVEKDEVCKIVFEEEESQQLLEGWLGRRTTNRLERVLKIWNVQLNLGIEFPVRIIPDGYPKEKMQIISANGKNYHFQIQYPTPMDDDEDINFEGKEYMVRRYDGALYTNVFDGEYYFEDEVLEVVNV